MITYRGIASQGIMYFLMVIDEGSFILQYLESDIGKGPVGIRSGMTTVDGTGFGLGPGHLKTA
jgi:hypothetical protein